MTVSGYLSYVYVLYLRSECIILMTPHMSLPIGDTTADELLENLTLYYNVQCITIIG